MTDSELGLQGVRQAIAILRQSQPQPTKPDLHAKATGDRTNIIGILAVVGSDIAKNQAKETTEEKDAGAESQKDDARKQRDQNFERSGRKI